MKWRPIYDKYGTKSKYAVRSECGRFTVCKVTVMGVDRFELYDGHVFKHTGFEAAGVKAMADMVKREGQKPTGEVPDISWFTEDVA